MFCPECGAEFVDGVYQCADCEVALVHEPPPADDGVPEYETVLETSELAVIPLIKSLLDSAEIPYVTAGEGLMNLFPSEALGAFTHESAGEVQIRVPPDRAQEARELLASGLEAEPDEPDDEKP